MEDGGLRMRMENGGWRIEDGESRMNESKGLEKERDN
jgi:hypothetical protein